MDDKLVILDANSFVKIHSSPVPESVSFAILQAHTQIHKLTLAHHRNLEYGNHVNGSSIGIYSEVQAKGATHFVSGYVFNNNPFNVTVLVFIMYYDKSGKTELKSVACFFCCNSCMLFISPCTWWLQLGV